MTKYCRNVVVGLLTVSGAVTGILLENICSLLNTIRAGLLGGGSVFLFSWIVIFLYRRKTFSYIPRIDIRVAMSEDNGRTYSDNIHSIPRDTTIFLKYEISAGANFPRYLFPGMSDCFKIVTDTFDLCDYSGKDGKFYQANALANRQKVNITLKLLACNNTREQPHTLKIKFETKLLQIYNKTIVLYADRPGVPATSRK